MSAFNGQQTVRQAGKRTPLKKNNGKMKKEKMLYCNSVPPLTLILGHLMRGGIFTAAITEIICRRRLVIRSFENPAWSAWAL
jgi:hypothetical protein